MINTRAPDGANKNILLRKNFSNEDIRIFPLPVAAEQVVKAEIFPFCFFLATSPFPPLCVASSRYRPSVIIQGKHSLVFPPSRFLSLNILSLLPDLPPLASSPLPHPCYLLNPISLMLPPPNVLLLPLVRAPLQELLWLPWDPVYRLTGLDPPSELTLWVILLLDRKRDAATYFIHTSSAK